MGCSWILIVMVQIIVVAQLPSTIGRVVRQPNYFTTNNHGENSPELLSQEYENKNSSLNFRDPKFFPLFTIIRFSNEACQTTSEENGICYTRAQCSGLGGIAAGSCAQGLGVCCQFFSTCGAIVNQNSTFFRNPDFPNKYKPSTGSDVCQIRVKKQPNVCQLKLVFIKFDVDGPSSVPAVSGNNIGTASNDAGSCKTDSLTITSSGATVPPVCGNMNGQHLFLDYGTSDTVTLNLLLSQNSNKDREWNMQILMIPCRSELRAPVGCLQYFQGVSGQVQSFNFQGGIHLANMDYSICVRMEDGMRSIEWSGCNPGDVKIAVPPAATPVPPTNPSYPTLCMTNQLDYLTIMGGVSYPLPGTVNAMTVPASGGDRFCDGHFGYAGYAVRSTVRPFIVHFTTNSGESTTANAEASAGFCLKWQQSPSGG